MAYLIVAIVAVAVVDYGLSNHLCGEVPDEGKHRQRLNTEHSCYPKVYFL